MGQKKKQSVNSVYKSDTPVDGPQRPKLVESSADHPGIRRIICLMTLNYLVIIYCFIPGRLWLQNSILACFFHLNVSESSN